MSWREPLEARGLLWIKAPAPSAAGKRSCPSPSALPSGSTGTDPEEFSREGPQEQPGAGRPSRGDALPWPFPPGGAPAHPSLPLGLPPRLRSAASSPRLARGVWGSRRESHPPHKPCPAPLLLPWPGFWGQTLPGAACSSAIPAAGDTGAAFGCHIPNRGRLCSLSAAQPGERRSPSPA